MSRRARWNLSRILKVAAFVSVLLTVGARAFGQAPVAGFQPEVLQSISSNITSTVGAGARAWGLGGAFVAVADDGTAASWNPAGLTSLDRPEIMASCVPLDDGYHTFPPYQNNVTNFVYGNGITLQQTGRSIDYLAFSYPFMFGKNRIVTQVALQELASYHYTLKLLNPSVLQVSTNAGALGDYVRTINGDVALKGAYRILSLTAAYTRTPLFSVGVALNYWKANPSHNATLQASFWFPNDTGLDFFQSFPLQQSYSLDVHGYNANIGFLMRFGRTYDWGVGVVYKTGPHLDGKLESLTDLVGTEDPILDQVRVMQRADASILWPDSYAIGLSWRPGFALRRWLLSADYTGVQWSDSKLELRNRQFSSVDCSDPFSCPPPTYFPAPDGEQPFPSNQPQVNTHQARLGTEYLVTSAGSLSVPLRLGVFTDEQVLPDGKGHAVRGWGFAVGTGLAFTNRFFLDVAYVRSSFSSDPNSGSPGAFTQYFDRRRDSSERVFLSMNYRFGKGE